MRWSSKLSLVSNSQGPAVFGMHIFYCNVVGLALWTVVRRLGLAGLDITHIRVADLLPQCRECKLLERAQNARENIGEGHRQPEQEA